MESVLRHPPLMIFFTLSLNLLAVLLSVKLELPLVEVVKLFVLFGLNNPGNVGVVNCDKVIDDNIFEFSNNVVSSATRC